jgi:UDP-N-acetyl-D-mannosaminuronic acid dehydrogenase
MGIAFAEQGKHVVLQDVDVEAVEKVNAGKLPFMEEGAGEALKLVLKEQKLVATTDVRMLTLASAVILVLGTPVDEHLNPQTDKIMATIRDIESSLRGDQLLVLRSTLYPGMTEKIHSYLRGKGKQTLVAYCPERLLEGKSLTEVHEIPQIVGGCSEAATEAAGELFGLLTEKIITTGPTEAEMAKLFTNAQRYINFAISNQFYMIADSHGLDFNEIYRAMVVDYPRLKSFSRAGFAAGPWLFKDTMQLTAYSGNNFFLGHSAMLVNEGMPDYIVQRLKEAYDLSQSRVAILGMAFKANSDDPRESLSFKLKKKLEIEAREVLCHDPYVKGQNFVSLEDIHKRADIVVVATPHQVYSQEDWSGKAVVDIQDFYNPRLTPKNLSV